MNKPNVKLEAFLNLPYEKLQKHGKFLFWEGTFLIFMGFIAIMLPLLFSMAIEIMLGVLLLVCGCFGLGRSISTKDIPGSLFSILTYLLFIGCGCFLLIKPLAGLMAMTIVVGIFFLFSGCLKTAFAMSIKPAANWGWGLFDGVISIIFAIIIFAQWPQSAAWVIGLLIGIKLIFLGNTMVMISSGLKKTIQNNPDNG